MNDYRQFYDLESYLFEVVRPRFHDQGYLSAFDFFCIVVWKANRAKAKVARRLLERDDAPAGGLESAVRRLTEGLAREPSPRETLRYLLQGWGFLLPLASAILTVLYPEEFTVYDSRVCDCLGAFRNLAHRSWSESLWSDYQQFKRCVMEATPQGLSLRDRDRYLWGKSFHKQLAEDVARGFGLQCARQGVRPAVPAREAGGHGRPQRREMGV